MRRLLIFIFFLPLVTAGLMVVGHFPAQAEVVCQVTDPLTGECFIWVEVPADPGTPVDSGPKDSGSGQACFWDPSKQGLSGPPAGPVPCSAEYGYWSNHYNCYISAVDPQPPAGDPSWLDHQPGDGAVYVCFQPQTDIDIRIWSQNAPAGADTGPTPRDVAQIAIAQMDLRAIDMGMVPQPGGDNLGIVGMPVWMWAQNPGVHTYGPIKATASAGGITITANARVRKITWDMGDGTKVVCTNAGTPYEARYGKKDSPDCGHTYVTSSASKATGNFTVTATSDWVVTWQGAGQTGTIRLNGLQRSAEVAVGEAQVLVE